MKEYTIANIREHCIKTMQFSRADSNAYKEHEITLSILDENIRLKDKEQMLTEKLEEKQAEIDSLNEFYETYDINHEGQTVLIDRNRFKEVIGADKDFSILVVNKLPEVEEN